MGLEFVVEEFPSLEQIKTTIASSCATSSSSSIVEATTKQINGQEAEEEEEEEACVTPKGEECKLWPALVCPPAPRKPRPAKRKAGPPPQGFYSEVPRDLTTVFVPLTTSRRPLISKRIRVG